MLQNVNNVLGLLFEKIEQQCLEQSCLVGDRVLARVESVEFERRLDEHLHVAAVLFAVGEEGEALVQDAVLDHNHLLGQILKHRQAAAFRIEPGVGAQLLRVGIERFDHPRDAKLVVALRAVQRADHQVHDAQVEDLLLGVGVHQLLLLLLDLAHQLFGVLVLAGHDVRHAQVGQHDRRHIEHVVVVLLHQLLVEAGRFLEFVLLGDKQKLVLGMKCSKVLTCINKT